MAQGFAEGQGTATATAGLLTQGTAAVEAGQLRWHWSRMRQRKLAATVILEAQGTAAMGASGHAGRGRI